MVSPRLYKSSQAYDFFLRSMGFENGINRFLQDLEVELPAGIRILDAGCGTGLLGLHFLNRIPSSTLLSTDLQPNFLRATLAKAAKRQLPADRLAVATADISTPQDIHLMTKAATTEHMNSSDLASADPQQSSAATHDDEFEPTSTLNDGIFGLICVGAVVGYANDTEASLRQLSRLLAPGGVLLNLEMSQSLTGRFVSHRYHYRNLSHARICQILEDSDCHVTTQCLRLRHLPAKLTRTAIIAKRNIASDQE
ncbi:methyltransferase [bacterium]|nr:methyltransferase [bacterium]MDB4561554.1 methyltransferase [bacterium]